MDKNQINERIQSSLRLQIMSELKKIFVQKDNIVIDERAKAAIITAASEMAIAADEPVISKEDVEAKLLSMITVSGEAKELVGMLSPQYVQQIIGYSVDFRDFGAAKSNYNAKKSEYDELYGNINALSFERHITR